MTNNKISFSLFILLLFAIFRPIVLGIYRIDSFNILEIFGILISFLILLALSININNIKIDSISIMILFYISYCFISLSWGSSVRALARYVLPYSVYFLAIAVLKRKEHVNLTIKAFFLGYSFLILMSTIFIITGRSESLVDYSGIERFQGIASGQHALAHSMLLFSFLYVIYNLEDIDNNKIINRLLVILLICSIYCIYKTYVRTAILGFILFWLGILWSKSKILFIYIFALTIPIFFAFKENIKTIIFQGVQNAIVNESTIDYASSGRLTIWKYKLYLFNKLNFEEKLLGLGLGNEGEELININKFIASHNDFLTIMFSTGIIGLAIYIIILITLILKILQITDNKMRYCYLSIIMSVITMNLVSVSYASRFELAQVFWFIMGIMRISYNNSDSPIDIYNNKDISIEKVSIQ